MATRPKPTRRSTGAPFTEQGWKAVLADIDNLFRTASNQEQYADKDAAATITGDWIFTGNVTLPGDIMATDHGTLAGLTDDDHTQYLLADGTRAMTGSLQMSDAGWIGIGAASERLIFDGTGGELEIAGANLNLNSNDLLGVGTLTAGTLTDGTMSITGGDISSVGTLTATTITDDTWSTTAGAFTGVASIATPTSITMAEDGWIGLTAEKLTFDHSATQITSSSDLMMGASKRTYYEASGSIKGTESIYSAANGYLDVSADTEVRIAATTVVTGRITASSDFLCSRAGDAEFTAYGGGAYRLIRFRNRLSTNECVSVTTDGSLHIPYGNVGIGTATPSAYAGLTVEDGAVCIKERATPTADAGYGKIYTKDDNVLYFQDGAGSEHAIAYEA